MMAPLFNKERIFMMNRFILWLIKRRFKLKWFEYFRFTNQIYKDVYWFEPSGLYKIEYRTTRSGKVQPVANCVSGVSINWLLDKDCAVEKVAPYEY